MWSKIKGLMPQKAFPISTKLTILYAAILCLILFSISLLTVFGVRFILNGQAHREMEISLLNITRYLESGYPINARMLDENLITPECVLQILDEQNTLIFDSKTYQLERIQQIRQDSDQDHRRIPLLEALLPDRPVYETDSEDAFSLQSTVKVNNQTYLIQLKRTFFFQIAFMRILTLILLIGNSIGVCIAILSGVFLSRKILKPIAAITETAKQIEVSDLSRRIVVPQSHDELSELARTFNHMLSRIHQGFIRQQHFVSDASHELRTPITVISGYADMIDRWGKKDTAALDEGIAAIKQEAAAMQKLIDKLLFLARADQGTQEIHKAPLQTKNLLDELFLETKLIAPHHQIRLDKNDPAVVWAEEALIKQMFRAFLENSIKYTPPNKKICLSAEKKQHYLEITIADEGSGIAADEQDKIFDRFYRADKSRSKATGGTGLGLAIARWIAVQHEIQLRLTSSPGKGTAITAQIPLYPPLK